MNRGYLTLVVLFAAWCASPGGVSAQSTETQRSQLSGVDYFLTSTGLFGANVSSGDVGLFYPRGSDNGYLFGAGLWFGAQKRVDGRMVSLTELTYNPNSGVSWFTPGTPGNASADATTPYLSNDYDRVTGLHTSGSATMPAWPMWLPQAQSAATLMMPGQWVDDNSERHADGLYHTPAFVDGVAEQYAVQYHDNDVARFEGQAVAGYPLGLQIRQHVYSWETGSLRNAVVLTYQVINTSPDTLFNCMLAGASDPDVGAAGNDHLRFYDADASLRSTVVWSDPETSGTFGTLLVTMLEAPVTDAMGFVDNARRSAYKYEGRVETSRNWIIELEPKNGRERYDFMSSSQLDGDNGTGDRRVLLGSSPFSMRPGDTARFAIAYRVLEDLATPPPGAVSEIASSAREIIDHYYRSSTASVRRSEAGTSGLAVHPNPARGVAVVGFELEQGASVAIRVADALGRVVLEQDLGMRPAGAYSHSIDLSALPAGAFRVELRTDQGTSSRPVVVVK